MKANSGAHHHNTGDIQVQISSYAFDCHVCDRNRPLYHVNQVKNAGHLNISFRMGEFDDLDPLSLSFGLCSTMQ